MEWIEVEKKQPDKSLKILAYIESRGTFAALQWLQNIEGISAWYSLPFNDFKVKEFSHWMPLPLSPYEK